jgi:hypothetical protein
VGATGADGGRRRGTDPRSHVRAAALALQTAESAGITLRSLALTASRCSPIHRIEGWKRPALNVRSRSRMQPEKLVMMANQIASFFAVQDEQRAVPQIADHIRRLGTRACKYG